MSSDYPGMVQHQILLQAVTAVYAGDARVRAVSVFGSLGRDNWDEYSDLDLDIVVADDVQVNVKEELNRLCEAFLELGERTLLMEADGDDAGDMVLASLIGLSVRYHPLHTTSPNIVDSLLVLAGELNAESIKAAGQANRTGREGLLLDTLREGVNRYLRLAVNVDIALQRRQFWRAFQLLHLMRESVLLAFTLSKSERRPYHVFEAEADAAMKAYLGATLPQYSLRSAQQALLALLDLAERDLPMFVGMPFQLSEAQSEVIARVRERQANLHLPE